MRREMTNFKVGDKVFYFRKKRPGIVTDVISGVNGAVVEVKWRGEPVWIFAEALSSTPNYGRTPNYGPRIR